MSAMTKTHERRKAKLEALSRNAFLPRRSIITVPTKKKKMSSEQVLIEATNN